jgi:hypothetical protein
MVTRKYSSDRRTRWRRRLRLPQDHERLEARLMFLGMEHPSRECIVLPRDSRM